MERGFLGRFLFPIRHGKKKQQRERVPECTSQSLDMEPPPSYSECSAYFYAPPSYEESVRRDHGEVNPPRRDRERRRSIIGVSWGSDTSISSSESSSSSLSSASSTASAASSSSSSSSSRSSSSTESYTPRDAPSPPATSYDSSPSLSTWLSAVSSSSMRNVDNRSRHRTATSEPIVCRSTTSSSDIVARTQPRMRSWTQCLRWVIQYTLEPNFRSTVAHFQCLVKEALRVSEQYGASSASHPIRLASLAVPRPTALSLKIWAEFVLAIGFKFSQSRVNNNNNNGNMGGGEEHGESGAPHEAVMARIFNENANNNNGTVNGFGQETEGLCVIVPGGHSPRRLATYKSVLTGLLELPHNAIKTAANMSRTETERIISLLTYLIQSTPLAMPLHHALVSPVCDAHRRPGYFLHSLDFTKSRDQNRDKVLRIPSGDVARRRFHLAKEILETLLRN